MKKSEVTKAIIQSLRAEFKKADWWPEVQSDVRSRIAWVVDNIEQVGFFFCRTFMVMFRWEFERRQIEGNPVVNPMAGYMTALLGMRISEEAFQCGSLPTRAVLDLYDYVAPNDADVTACMFLCNRIETLQRAGLLKVREDKLVATEDELKVAFKVTPKKEPPTPPLPKPREEITWDFEEEDQD